MACGATNFSMLFAQPHQALQRRQELITAMTKALLDTGALAPGGGSLVQTWMPTIVTEGQGSAVTLVTKGLPYALIGPGDMLAAFRCLSCTYKFTTDRCQLARMGAPGRVFATGEVETCENLQQCNASIYLRVKDAARCGVTSTVLLPVFCCPVRREPVAVLEINQCSVGATDYSRVFNWARTNLEEQELYIPSNMAASVFDMQSHHISIQYASSGNSALGSILSRTPSSEDPLDAPVPQQRPSLGRHWEEGEAESTLHVPAKQAKGHLAVTPDNFPPKAGGCTLQPHQAGEVCLSHCRERHPTASVGKQPSRSQSRGTDGDEVSSDEQGDSREARSREVAGSGVEPTAKRACRGVSVAPPAAQSRACQSGHGPSNAVTSPRVAPSCRPSQQSDTHQCRDPKTKCSPRPCRLGGSGNEPI